MDTHQLLGLTLEKARSIVQEKYPDIKIKTIYYSSPIIRNGLTVSDGVYRVVRQKACGINELELTVSLFRNNPECGQSVYNSTF